MADNIGLSPIEEKQIDALSLGATEEEASLNGRIEPVHQIFPPKQDPNITPYIDDNTVWVDSGEEVVVRSSPFTKDKALEVATTMQLSYGLSDIEKQQLANDLVIRGYSTVLENFLQKSRREHQIQVAKEASRLTDPEVKVDVYKARVQQYDIFEDLDTRAIARNVPDNQRWNESFINDILDKETQVRKEFREEFIDSVEWEGGTVGNILEVIGGIMPGASAQALYGLTSLLKKKYGADLDTPIKAWFLSGNSLVDIRDWLATLSSTEQKGAVSDIIRYMSEHAGWFGGNDFIEASLVQSILANETGDIAPGEGDHVQALENIVSLTDAALGVGSLIRVGRATAGTYRAARTKSTLDKLTRVDPEAGANATNAVVDDASGQVAAALGANRADVAERAYLAKFDESEFADVSSDFIDEMKLLSAELEARGADMSIYLTPEEKASHLEKIAKGLEESRKRKLWKNSGYIRPTEDGIEVGARFGKNTKRGWLESEKKALLEEVEKLRKVHGGDNVKIIGREYNGKIGKNPAPDGTQQYFIQVDYVDDYKKASAGAFDPNDIIYSGASAHYRADISSGLSQRLSNALYVSSDREKATEKIAHKFLQPLAKAGSKEQRAVMALLDDGAKQGVIYTPSEIRAQLRMDENAEQVVQAYIGVRQFSDMAYKIRNAELRTYLDSKNMRYISLGDDYHAFAAPVADPSGIRFAYDPLTGEVVDLRGSIKKFLQDGGRIFSARNRQTSTASGKSSNYIMVHGGVKAGPLPERVLKYIEGYVPRIYEDQHFITMRPNKLWLDGEILTGTQIIPRTIGTAPSRKAALERIEGLRAQYPDAELGLKNDRSLTYRDRLTSEVDYQEGTGGLFYGQRGKHLESFDGEFDVLSETTDVVGSMLKQASALANRMEVQPVLDNMKKKWLNTYGSYTTGIRPGVFPTSRSQIAGEQVANADLQKARAAWAYINLQETNMTTTQTWKELMFQLGEWVESKGAEKVGKYIRTEVGKKDPIARARSFNFISTIVLNPFRQLFLQSQQFFYLAGIDPAYVLSGAASRESMPMLMALLREGEIINKIDISGYAKAAGISPAEFRRDLDAIKSSGLIEAIDSHLLGRDAVMAIEHTLNNNKLQNAIQKASNLGKTGIAGIKRVGFDLGEQINLVHTYNIARRRWMKNNPGKSVDTKFARAEIAADTRQLALGMTQPGALGYQKGIFSLMTQFWSIQHKAFLGMSGWIPYIGKYSNQAITKGEAFRITAGQLLLYGTSGVGLTALADEMFQAIGWDNPPEEVRHMVAGGLYDTLFNFTLEAASGQTSDLAVSQSIAAGSGWAETFTQFLEEAPDRNVFEMFAGASASSGSKVITAVGTLGRAIQGGLEGTLTPKQAQDTVKSFARIASIYDKYDRAKTQEHLHAWVSKNRTSLGVPITEVENVVAAITGVQGYQQRAAYETYLDLQARQEEIDGVATELYNQWTRMYATTENTSYFTEQESIGEFMTEHSAYLKAKYNALDYDAIMNSVIDKIRRKEDTENGSMIDVFLKRATSNRTGNIEEQLNDAVTKGLVPKDKADALKKELNFIYDLKGEEEIK